MFFHYNQFLDGSAFARLEKAIEASLDRSFPNAALQCSVPEGSLSPQVLSLYKELCHLADYSEAT
ncbi:MAG: hypothetical protein L0Y56_21340 [Nitrospira sp.]|nr:hypothetical protein [Nitrospira sp.]